MPFRRGIVHRDAEGADLQFDIGARRVGVVEHLEGRGWNAGVGHEALGKRLARFDACRGLGGPEPFKLVEELAELLGGAVGASRAACDARWIDHSRQVGLTGTTVTPNLYITIGISGASQHMAGCSGAKHIVAVNKDPEANIFKEASFGVVGDWGKVLPSFIGAVRDLVRLEYNSGELLA